MSWNSSPELRREYLSLIEAKGVAHRIVHAQLENAPHRPFNTHSALTIVYLLDVPPSSKPGALARNAWNTTRGWTFQELLAPKIVLFYQKVWTLYLGDRSPNHKNSVAIMQEMGDTTGIDASALAAFHPGMHRGRRTLEKS
ncbi:hypothetical protein EDD22DRAFT_970347 [Suillus occidentalis]|nr:hypothetical protein EDD22DRAFT_970347 [Suillus occidentalis]